MRKRTIFSLLIWMSLITSVYAETWQDCWSQAIELCSIKNYEEAENQFDLAITYLERSNNQEHP